MPVRVPQKGSGREHLGLERHESSRFTGKRSPFFCGNKAYPKLVRPILTVSVVLLTHLPTFSPRIFCLRFRRRHFPSVIKGWCQGYAKEQWGEAPWFQRPSMAADSTERGALLSWESANSDSQCGCDHASSSFFGIAVFVA